MRPATCWPSVPSIIAAAAGVGAAAELPYGNPHAGVEFHRSCTVGLLLRLKPNVVRLFKTVVWPAYRKSALSMPSCPLCGSKVTWRKPPTWGVTSPPTNKLIWSGNRIVPFWAFGWAFWVDVNDVWSMIEIGGNRLSSKFCCPPGLVACSESLRRYT